MAEIACPVEALKSWLSAAGIAEGAVFVRIWNKRTQRVTIRRLAARNVAAIVKAGAAKLGFDPSTFGGHSLRAGFVTSAVKRGANLIKITDVAGHRSLEMLKTYSRDAEAFVACRCGVAVGMETGMRDFMYYFLLLSIIVYPFGIALAVLCPARWVRRVFLMLVAAWFIAGVVTLALG